MKFVSIINCLPTYTQVSVLYQILGTLNASALNMAAREVANDLHNLQAAEKQGIRSAISIDRYNELLNELRQREMDTANFVDAGTGEIATGEFTKDELDREGEPVKVNIDRLSALMTLRAPLLATFNAAQAKLPRGDNMPDFSFEESLARQLAREWSTENRAAAETDKALVETGAVTAEELEAADKKRFEDDQDFKKEFKFLMLDKLNDKEPMASDEDDGNAAFDALGWDFGSRMCKRILPKLLEAKAQQITRRSYDADAPTNIILIGLAINEFKKFVGESDAEKKLAELQAKLAA
jgi:hypothetical protein